MAQKSSDKKREFEDVFNDDSGLPSVKDAGGEVAYSPEILPNAIHLLPEEGKQDSSGKGTFPGFDRDEIFGLALCLCHEYSVNHAMKFLYAWVNDRKTEDGRRRSTAVSEMNIGSKWKTRVVRDLYYDPGVTAGMLKNNGIHQAMSRLKVELGNEGGDETEGEAADLAQHFASCRIFDEKSVPRENDRVDDKLDEEILLFFMRLYVLEKQGSMPEGSLESALEIILISAVQGYFREPMKVAGYLNEKLKLFSPQMFGFTGFGDFKVGSDLVTAWCNYHKAHSRAIETTIVVGVCNMSSDKRTWKLYKMCALMRAANFGSPVLSLLQRACTIIEMSFGDLFVKLKSKQFYSEVKAIKQYLTTYGGNKTDELSSYAAFARIFNDDVFLTLNQKNTPLLTALAKSIIETIGNDNTVGDLIGTSLNDSNAKVITLVVDSLQRGMQSKLLDDDDAGDFMSKVYSGLKSATPSDARYTDSGADARRGYDSDSAIAQFIGDDYDADDID